MKIFEGIKISPKLETALTRMAEAIRDATFINENPDPACEMGGSIEINETALVQAIDQFSAGIEKSIADANDRASRFIRSPKDSE